MDNKNSSSAPLLTKNSDNAKEEETSFKADIWSEIKMIWFIAGPAILTSLFQYSLGTVTQTMVGHIGTLELAAFGMQNLFIAGIGFGVMLGMGSALETLCGQAYGAGSLNMMGVYMQRSWIILIFTGLVLTVVYIFASPILKLLGQSAEISELAGKFAIWMIPQLFAYALNFPIQKFLQAQSKVMVMAWISLASLVFHVFLSWVFVQKLEMGLVGAAITLNFSWWLLVLAQLAYILSGACKEAWSGFTWLAFAELPGFIGLSCASAVMLCLEYWCVMVLIIFAGLFDHPQITVDAASICMSVESWLFMIPLGFTAAISVRVSNELGRGNSKRAKFSVWVMVMMAVVIQTIFAVMIFVTKKDFPSIFTADEWVMYKVTKIAPFLCVSIFLSSVQPVLSGVAIGAGWQAIVAWVNIGCYYLVGLATGAILGFKFHLGLEGLWGGVLLGIALQTIILIIITMRTDWEKEVSLAKERVAAWGSSDAESTFVSNGFQDVKK